MEVAPRLKSVEKRAEQTVRFAEMEKLAPRSPPPEHDEKIETEEKSDEPVKTGFFNNTIVLIVIFAAIIIVLILVVVWLVGRNDRLYGWIRGTPAPPAPPQPAAPRNTSKPSVHADLVNAADEDELAMYANIGDKKEERKEDHKADAKEVENHEEDAKVEEKKEDPKPSEPDEDATAAMERDLEAQLEALESATEDAVNPSAISEAIDAEVSKMDAVQHRPIEQVSKTTHGVVKVFPTNESVSQANYDIAAVLACCRGEKPTHKKYIWRFQEDIEEPQD
jgi:hypothetical protein